MKSKVVWMDTIISLTITVGCFVQMDRWITHGPTQTGTGRRREELYLVLNTLHADPTIRGQTRRYPYNSYADINFDLKRV